MMLTLPSAKQFFYEKMLSAGTCYNNIFSFCFGAIHPGCLKSKIDSVLKQWNSSNIQGGAVGIMRNDSLIYARGFGVANLERHTAITPQSIFYTTIHLYGKNYLQSDGDLYNIVILRNKNDAITGFELSDGAIEHCGLIKQTDLVELLHIPY